MQFQNTHLLECKFTFNCLDNFADFGFCSSVYVWALNRRPFLHVGQNRTKTSISQKTLDTDRKKYFLILRNLRWLTPTVCPFCSNMFWRKGLKQTTFLSVLEGAKRTIFPSIWIMSISEGGYLPLYLQNWHGQKGHDKTDGSSTPKNRQEWNWQESCYFSDNLVMSRSSLPWHVQLKLSVLWGF